MSTNFLPSTRQKNAIATGSTLSSEIQLYRYELIESALLARVTLSKVDAMHPFPEKHYAHGLTSGAHLSEVNL